MATCTDGLYFGASSAIISSVVLIASLWPAAKFRFTLVIALVTIALVDSIGDAYALWNSGSNVCGALASIGIKVAIAGLLAGMVLARAPGGSILVVLGAIVAAHLAVSALRHWFVPAIGTFAAAILASLLLRKVAQGLEKNARLM